MTMSKTNPAAWQKLSPVAIIYFVLHFIVRFVKDGLINVAPAFAIWVTQVENKLFWFISGASILAVVLVIYAVLYYLNFRYKITEHEIVLRKGVFKKERVTLNFAKVQNVNLATPFYFAPFSLVNCHFDAAGSSQQEVVLPGISNDYANTMRDQIFNYRAKPEPAVQQVELQEKAIAPDLTLANLEVAKFGLMSGMMFLVLAALAPFTEQITDYIKQDFAAPLTELIANSLNSNEHAEIAAGTIIVLSGIGIFVLASVLGALIRFYNYELSLEQSKIKRISGLFERHQMSLSINKIQSIEVKQNWIAKLLKRYTISCKQINNSHANTVKKGQSLIVPVLTKAQVKHVMNLCWDKQIDITQVPFQPIAINYFYKTYLLYWLLPLTIFSAVAYQPLLNGAWPLLIVLLLAGAGLSFLRYKRFGFYFDGEQVFTRKGLIGVSYKVFKGFKIQQIATTQTPPMRKQQLSTLRFQLASGGITIPYLPTSHVNQVMNQLIFLAETSKKRWM
ncbi:PH domain-containing protein [Pseudoalteromonas sp. SSM20]|uniref:PH domain-containing protein n=1 Tax=Pseudoalteromonas sp. SSM20 TaxID=3139394 RepID=UPI003BAD5A09